MPSGRNLSGMKSASRHRRSLTLLTIAALVVTTLAGGFVRAPAQAASEVGSPITTQGGRCCLRKAALPSPFSSSPTTSSSPAAGRSPAGSEERASHASSMAAHPPFMSALPRPWMIPPSSRGPLTSRSQAATVSTCPTR
jgi:hypothetical protein